jgi:gliding motility-associated-like protein
VTTLRNCNNQPPAIDTTPLSTQVGSVLTFNLLSLLTDPDNNLDLSTLQIVSQPESGALASIENGNLQIDYVNVSFTGIDRLIIQVCDVEGSCTQQTLEVEVIGDVVIYNALSPNNDGLNDYFMIQYADAIPEENMVTIYNRWGDVVFEISNYDNDIRVFKGLSNSGKELPTGTYFYKIEFSSGKSGKSGYLFLKR